MYLIISELLGLNISPWFFVLKDKRQYSYEHYLFSFDIPSQIINTTHLIINDNRETILYAEELSSLNISC